MSVDATARVDAAQERRRLEAENDRLRRAIAVETWRLESLRARRWWRLWQVLADVRARRRPALTLPLALVRVVRTPSTMPPPPGAPGLRMRPEPRGRQAAATSWAWSPGDDTDVELHRWRQTLDRRPRDPAGLVVATVMDEFSQACFAPECDLVTFPPDGWRDALEQRPPHLLLVESAWRGNAGTWEQRVGSYDDPGTGALRELAAWCRSRAIPVAFWNKEDPLHFRRFREAASLADAVFTTDAGSLPNYLRLEPSAIRSATPLPFAAQPLLHNPVAPTQPRLARSCFAGTFYKGSRGARSEQLEMLLDAAHPFGLTIYDRMHGSEQTDLYGFPERFADDVAGRLPYADLVHAYKRFRVFLNVNTVETSPTMFARRVFELLACDTAVVSTRSTGMTALFGDLVPVASDPGTAREAVERLLTDEPYRRRTVREARRLVLGAHTYRHRLASVARTLGYDVDATAAERVAVLVLLEPGTTAAGLGGLVDDLLAQTTPPTEVLVGSPDAAGAAALEALPQRLPGTRLRVVAQRDVDRPDGRRERWRELATLATSPWVATVRPGARYAPRHLADLVDGTRFARSDVLGRGEVENRYVDAVHPDSALVRRDVVAGRGWCDDVEQVRAWHGEGVRVYSGELDGFTAAP